MSRILLLGTLLFSSVFYLRGQVITPVLDDSTAKIYEVMLRAGQSFTIPEEKFGMVWVALNAGRLVSKDESGKQRSRLLTAGDAEFDGTGTRLTLGAGSKSWSKLVVVVPKTPHQELTITPITLKQPLEDASVRNKTLLVAVTQSHIQDIRNSADESRWVPEKPKLVSLKPGEVAWVAAGIHHFRELNASTAQLVSIEW